MAKAEVTGSNPVGCASLSRDLAHSPRSRESATSAQCPRNLFGGRSWHDPPPKTKPPRYGTTEAADQGLSRASAEKTRGKSGYHRREVLASVRAVDFSRQCCARLQPHPDFGSLPAGGLKRVRPMKFTDENLPVRGQVTVENRPPSTSIPRLRDEAGSCPAPRPLAS